MEEVNIFADCKNCHGKAWHLHSWGWAIWVVWCPAISAYRVLRVPICPKSTIYVNSNLKKVAEWLDDYMGRYWAPFSAMAAFGYR